MQKDRASWKRVQTASLGDVLLRRQPSSGGSGGCGALKLLPPSEPRGLGGLWQQEQEAAPGTTDGLAAQSAFMEIIDFCKSLQGKHPQGISSVVVVPPPFTPDFAHSRAQSNACLNTLRRSPPPLPVRRAKTQKPSVQLFPGLLVAVPGREAVSERP